MLDMGFEPQIRSIIEGKGQDMASMESGGGMQEV